MFAANGSATGLVPLVVAEVSRPALVWWDGAAGVFRLKCGRCGVDAVYGQAQGNLAVSVAESHVCYEPRAC